MAEKIDKAIVAFMLTVIVGVALLSIFGCATQVKPEMQLTKQEVKEVVADVVKQSSQNGMFNFQFDDGTVVGLTGIVFAGGLAASFTRKGVTYGVGTIKRKRSLAQLDSYSKRQ